MAYDPTNFFNNGTLVGVAGNVNAPGGQGTWVIVNGVASYYPPNSTAYIPGAGITITGTAPVLTIANAGVVDLVQGSITAAGVIDIGANLTLNAGGTLSGSAGGGVTAEVGTIFSSFNTLVAGGNISFSGTSPDLTLSSTGGAGGITEFVQGTITATGTATVGTGLTLTGTTNPTLTAGTAAGTIGVEFGGTLYPTLAAGSGFTLTGSGATLTGSASGGGSSPYTPPVLSGFTIFNQPSGSTIANSSTGLVINLPSSVAFPNAALLWDNNGYPGSAPQITIGQNLSYLSTISGVTFVGLAGIAIGDASGKFVTFSLNVQTNGQPRVTVDYWNSPTSYNAAGPILGYLDNEFPFLQVVDNGSNFVVSGGVDLNSLVLVGSVSKSAFIGTPTKIGIFSSANSLAVGDTFFEYSAT